MPESREHRPRRAKINDQGLRKILKPGSPVTLVLGAGVSAPRGVPLWSELLGQAWKVVSGRDPYAIEHDMLKRARHVCEREGFPADFVKRLDVERHPFEYQFGFERVLEVLLWRNDDPRLWKQLGLRRRRRRRDDGLGSDASIAELFTQLLRTLIYRTESRRIQRKASPLDTLSLIARAVRRSATSPVHRRLIAQVITFNVDDLLEREVNAGCRRDRPFAVPIARASAVRPLRSPKAIPIYHLHGFVPWELDKYPYRFEDGGQISETGPPLESLVFSDEQYWRAVGNPTGFASRLFIAALSGRCVFIGLSMTDLNVIRWLAQDSIERRDDLRRLASGWDPTESEFTASEELLRHYWIARGSVDVSENPTPIGVDLLRRILERRGVSWIGIPSWDSKEFRAWWKACFLS